MAMMEILCAYGMRSRIWKESKFGMIGLCKVCFLYKSVSYGIRTSYMSLVLNFRLPTSGINKKAG
jgi:hypothetical protein